MQFFPKCIDYTRSLSSIHYPFPHWRYFVQATAISGLGYYKSFLICFCLLLLLENLVSTLQLIWKLYSDHATSCVNFQSLLIALRTECNLPGLLGPARARLCCWYLQVTFPFLHDSALLAFILFLREAKLFTTLAHAVPCDYRVFLCHSGSS